jgi:hypothetical protein
MSDFDPEFAGPAEWAAMYRSYGLQVIPCYAPGETASWKRPHLAEWVPLQEAIVPDATFARWYGPGGEYADRRNMGIITGAASDDTLVVDLDDHKTPAAAQWWAGLIALENNNMDIETVEQRTGGGGRQKLFRYPKGWRAPTNRTSIGVDIRGQAGFAVMAPSRHESGRDYEWMPGRAPWEVEIAMAPQWLLDAIEALVAAHGGEPGAGASQRTASPGSDTDAFGNYQDGREEVMFRTVWREVLEWYRECPIKPPESDWLNRAVAAYEVYERKVANRHEGMPKREGLEKDGRGPTAFRQKWRATMRHWGSPRMVKEAAAPRPQQEAPDHEDEFANAQEKAKEQAKADPKAGLYERLYVKAIKAMADPLWLIVGLMIEGALGFIFGPPGSLKTFVAIDIALHLATGKSSWWGRPMQRKGAVVYICSEGYASMKYRIAAWERHRGVNADNAPFCLIRQNINFMKLEDVAKLLETVQAVADETGEPIVAVFVDTVSRVLPGAEENLQKDMTLFIAACDAVRQRFRTTVVGVHHTNAGGGFRGSTVMPAAGDFILETRREPGAMSGSIFAKKVKDSEDGWEDFFEVTKVELGDIAGRASLCLDKADTPPPQSGWPDKDTCQRILDAMAEAWRNAKPWSPAYQARNSGRYAPAIMVRSFKVSDLKKAQEMIEVWLQNEILSFEEYDAHTKVKGLRVIGSIS